MVLILVAFKEGCRNILVMISNTHNFDPHRQMAQQATSQLSLSPPVPAQVDNAALGTSLNPVLPMALEQLQVLERLRQLRAWQQQQQDSLLRRQQEQVARLRSEQDGRRRQLQQGQAQSGRGDRSSTTDDGDDRAGNSLKGVLPLRSSSSVAAAQPSLTRFRSGDEYRPTAIQHSPPLPGLERNSDASGPPLIPTEGKHSSEQTQPTALGTAYTPRLEEEKPVRSHGEPARSNSPVAVFSPVSPHVVAGTPDTSIGDRVAGREAGAMEEGDGRDTKSVTSRGRKSDVEVRVP